MTSILKAAIVSFISRLPTSLWRVAGAVLSRWAWFRRA